MEERIDHVFEYDGAFSCSCGAKWGAFPESYLAKFKRGPCEHWMPKTAGSEMDERGWLIERWIYGVLKYWCGRDNEDFRESVDDAIRFAREVDANIILVRQLEGHGRCALHLWHTTIGNARESASDAGSDINKGVVAPDQGRPVKPHRSGGGLPAQPKELPLPNYTDLPDIIRKSTWQDEKLRESAATLVRTILDAPDQGSVRNATDEQDAKRMEWLDKNMRVLRAGSDGARLYIDLPPADSLRDAIDAAIRALPVLEAAKD